jgi:hypothetical protein
MNPASLSGKDLLQLITGRGDISAEDLEQARAFRERLTEAQKAEIEKHRAECDDGFYRFNLCMYVAAVLGFLGLAAWQLFGG